MAYQRYRIPYTPIFGKNDKSRLLNQLSLRHTQHGNEAIKLNGKLHVFLLLILAEPIEYLIVDSNINKLL